MNVDPPPTPPPVRVRLPGGDEVTGLLLERRQLPGGWYYLVAVDLWVSDEDGVMAAAPARMWVDAPGHVRPAEGVDPAAYEAVPTHPLPDDEARPPSLKAELGPRRPHGWVVQKLSARRGPDRAVVHAVDCEEAPAGAPVMGWKQALDAAERPGTRLCALCGAAHELTPLLKGFDTGFE
ncbi:DUF6233 domain-containing protein [Streptomyces sp. NPDC048258]|uniref:DUF6233 domain-containing protein n=1 Tax=Streptomyces sp. NPDC048258 TaxID=3365527 RepID=UPI003717ED5F